LLLSAWPEPGGVGAWHDAVATTPENDDGRAVNARPVEISGYAQLTWQMAA